MLAGNPRDSAMQEGTNANIKLANLSKIGGKRGGGSSTIPVPQMQLLYTPQGGKSTDPNVQIQTNARVSTQGGANSVYDSLALKKGGSSRRRNTKRSRKSRRKSRRCRKSRRN
jgi:hypothetical protein